MHFTPTLTSALERQRKESIASSSPRSPLPLPIPDRVRPFPLHADSPEHHQLSSSPSNRPSSPMGSLPTRVSLPHSPAGAAAPIAFPLRQAIGGSGREREASPASSMSSSPRHRRISTLGSISVSSGVGAVGLDFPAHGAAGTIANSTLGGGGSNASPRFGGGGLLREPAELPFAVGLGSGRTSGVMERERTRKESLLGASGSVS